MSKIEELKHKWNSKTTEELFGIDKPADFQCSFIDELQKYARYIEKDTNIRNDDFDDLIDKLREVEYYIPDIQNGLEKLREAIDSVRVWGQSWKDLFKEVVEKNNVNLDEWM